MMWSSVSSLATLGLWALGAAADSTPTYTDSKTGIKFASHADAESGMTFGLAVSSESSSTDFIGQIAAPITQGYAGAAMGSTMANTMLIVAYPNDDEVVASLREATTYANPKLLSNSKASLMPITKGTYVNETAFVYTFLCKGCILDDGSTWTMKQSSAVMGYVMSKTALDDPSSDDAVLNYHDTFGLFGLPLSAAKSSKFSTWSAMASKAKASSSSSSSSGSGSAANVTTTTSNATYDYIVAGGGASGIIAAARIAEAGHSVLLLERGPASTYSSGGSISLDWNDTLTPFDVPGLSCHLPDIPGASDTFCSDTAGMAGCLLGGSSSVNCMLWMKPPQRDFDDKWPTGWKWDDVSAAASKLYERNPGEITASEDGKMYDQKAYDVLAKHFENSGWKGVNGLEDVDTKDQMFTRSPYSVLNGLRAGPVQTYLPLAQKLKNFHLQLNTQVIRAVRSGSKITGVEVQVGSSSTKRTIINVNDGGRVVLAAGAMSSPRILFRSGIGPEKQIANVKAGDTKVTLPPKSDWIILPVGEKIMDHAAWHVVWNIKNTTATAQWANQTSLSEDNFLNPSSSVTELYNTKGSGPLAQGDLRFNSWTAITDKVDGSVRYVQATYHSTSNGTVFQEVFLTHGTTSTGVLGIDTGGVTELTTTPWANTAADKRAVEEFMNQQLAASRKAGSLIEYAGSANATGADLMAGSPLSGTHYVASARMGTSDGTKSGGTDVVDTDTKVYGTDNLFVVDASIHPDLPTGNTQAIVMVVAEKAAEKILALGGSSSASSSSSSGSSSSGSSSSGSSSSGSGSSGSSSSGSGSSGSGSSGSSASVSAASPAVASASASVAPAAVSPAQISQSASATVSPKPKCNKKKRHLHKHAVKV